MVKVPKLKMDSYQPLRDVIFETLRKAIVTGEIKPGERLMEVSLAEQMGVSRTPVREAIRRLEAEGLVTMTPSYQSLCLKPSYGLSYRRS